MDQLTAMKVFQTVCEMDGFAPAARRLALSTSAVTRHVAALETVLGVRLLERTTRSVRVTDVGAQYLQDVREILAQIAEAEESARALRESPRGRLCVAAPLIFGRIHVAPIVRHYMSLYPDVAVALVLSDRNAQLLEEGIDVAIRLGPVEPSTIIARRIGETRRVLVGSPDYLNHRGRPAHPRELAAHDTVLYEPAATVRAWNFLDRRGGRKLIAQPISPRFTSNSADTAIALAVEGGGLCQAPYYQVHKEVASGALEVLLDAFETTPMPIHAVHLSARFVPSKVRLFLELTAHQAGRWNFL